MAWITQSGLDIVNWPKTERDGYVFTSLNTVVNAFHLQGMQLMAEIAAALGNTADAEYFSRETARTQTAFQKAFFNEDTGIYRDGEKTEHSSLHANLFPLAFGLVPEEHRDGIRDRLSEQGMRCSVYAAQYLPEGMNAQVELPGTGGIVSLNGGTVEAVPDGDYLIVPVPVTGQARFEVGPI